MSVVWVVTTDWENDKSKEQGTPAPACEAVFTNADAAYAFVLHEWNDPKIVARYPNAARIATKGLTFQDANGDFISLLEMTLDQPSVWAEDLQP